MHFTIAVFFIFCVHCRSDIHFNYVRTEALFHSSRIYHLPYYFDVRCCANPSSGNIFRVFVLLRRMVHHLQKGKVYEDMVLLQYRHKTNLKARKLRCDLPHVASVGRLDVLYH